MAGCKPATTWEGTGRKLGGGGLQTRHNVDGDVGGNVGGGGLQTRHNVDGNVGVIVRQIAPNAGAIATY